MKTQTYVVLFMIQALLTVHATDVAGPTFTSRGDYGEYHDLVILKTSSNKQRITWRTFSASQMKLHGTVEG
jgi:hypothetical protein